MKLMIIFLIVLCMIFKVSLSYTQEKFLTKFQDKQAVDESFNKHSLRYLQDEYDNDTPEGETDKESPSINSSKESSSKVSIGLIIGIIAGVIVVIAIIILVICLCRKKNQKIIFIPAPPLSNETLNTFDVSINDDIIQVKNENIIEEKNNNQKINIILMTTSQNKIKILIDANKKMKDLIKCYFEIIKKPDVYGDESIRFILNANFIPHNSEDLIKNYVKKDNEVILIADEEDKIYPSFFN